MHEVLEHFVREFQLPLKNPVLVFSLILFIILLSPIMLRRFNIPGIIVLIISGVIIGPHGFYLLENNSAVDLFSTIGLLYIMFIAGLELDLHEFRVNKNKSLVFGLFTFALPLIIGFPVCHYLLGYDFNASFLTASMFATHTLVAYPLVSKWGISKNQAVAVTVGGTILTDTAVLIILAVVMGNSKGTLNQEFWIRLGVSFAIFSVIMFAVIPRFAKWFFSKLESEKHSHYIFVLSVVFFAAFLAEAAGLEPIIGAFAAGLALNPLVPHSSPLMNRIEFIGNALFIPLFLISVGMLVDVSVIFSGYMAIVIALTLSAVALFGKWLAAMFTQLIFRYSKAQGQLIFGLSSAHAAATLAVIMVGYKAGILDENILNGTIILILITCIVASLATEKAAKQIVAASENNETNVYETAQPKHEHILVPLANIANMGKLLDFALLIKDKKSTQPISILSVVPNNEEAEENILKSKNKLDEYSKQASASEAEVTFMAAIDHNIANGISRTAREIMADVVIIGWPTTRGMMDHLMGVKMENILSFSDKNIFISDFVKPLVVHKSLILLTSPLAEKEQGFSFWLRKVAKLSQELSIPVKHFGNKTTQTAIDKAKKEVLLNFSIDFTELTEWDDFEIVSCELKEDDLLVVISSRKHSVSYNDEMDDIPTRLEKHFATNNKIIVYPQQ
ncbi:MAG: cation:proton antiporter [Bacteroidia bacterium]